MPIAAFSGVMTHISSHDWNQFNGNLSTIMTYIMILISLGGVYILLKAAILKGALVRASLFALSEPTRWGGLR